MWKMLLTFSFRTFSPSFFDTLSAVVGFRFLFTLFTANDVVVGGVLTNAAGYVGVLRDKVTVAVAVGLAHTRQLASSVKARNEASSCIAGNVGRQKKTM